MTLMYLRLCHLSILAVCVGVSDAFAREHDSSVEVSTALWCVRLLVVHFFIIYSVVSVVQTLNKLQLVQLEREAKWLESVVDSVNPSPMLCVLFLVTRMRAVQLAEGYPDHVGLPQWWVKAAMVVCTGTLLSLTLYGVLCGIVFGDAPGALSVKAKPRRLLVGLQHALTFLLYMSFSVVCVGVCIMQPPPQLLGTTSFNPALVCIIALTVLYFFVHLVFKCIQTKNEFQRQRFSVLQEMFHSCTSVCAVFPALSCLFIGARLRAMQLGFPSGDPPWWMQLCFVLCTVSFILQTALSAVDVLPTKSDRQDNVTSHAPKLVLVSKALLMACLYVAVLVIVFGVPCMGDGRILVPFPLHCAGFVLFLYFTALLFLDGTRVVRAFNSSRLSGINGFLTEQTEEAAVLWPMLCILFLSTLLQAFQLTNMIGAPPAWCQGTQILAVLALCMVIVTNVFAWRGRDGVSQVVSSTSLYILVLVICVSLFSMTRQSSHGPGAVAL